MGIWGVQVIVVIEREMIAGEKPIVYRHPLSHLVDSLPYIDGEPTAHKSQIAHLIRSEQELIQNSQEHYLQDMKLPHTPFIDSKQFEELVVKIKEKQKVEPRKLGVEELGAIQTIQQIKQIVKTSQINTQYSLYKNINLEIQKKFGPALLRQQVDVLQKAKDRVKALIEQQNKSINDINVRRKYEQLQNYERIQTIKDRVRILISKQSSTLVSPSPQKRIKPNQ